MLASKLPMRSTMTRAERRGLKPVESKIRGAWYIIAPDDKEIAVVCERGGEQQRIILPFRVVKELAGIAETLDFYT